MSQITGWENDNNFLHATANLLNKRPEWILEDICKKVGQKITYRQVLEGGKFPAAVRNEIRYIYNKRMAIEIKIVKDCMEQSKKEFRKIVPYMILVVMIVLTILVS